MEKLDKDIVKSILKTIKTKGIIGSKLLSIVKEQNPSYDQTLLYITLKILTELGCIDNYIAPEDDNCKVKIRYKLSEKGNKILDSI